MAKKGSSSSSTTTNSRPNNKKLKAKHPYNDLSDRECETGGCVKKIKTRLVLLLDAKLCYWCHQRNRKRGTK